VEMEPELEWFGGWECLHCPANPRCQLRCESGTSDLHSVRPRREERAER
jgi:hypothetical protein